MPSFDYQASDAQGQPVRGRLVAGDVDDARRQLAARGLTPGEITLSEATPDDGPPAERAPRAAVRLSGSEAEQVVAGLAEVTLAEVPLAQGLRAAAAESTNRRIALALMGIAEEVERGKSLQAVLASDSPRFPAHVAGLIAAAARTSQLGPALEELVDHHRQMREAWWSVAAALAYPVLVLGLATAIFGFLIGGVVPIFGEMFRDFELELPAVTLALIQVSDGFQVLFTGPQKWLTFGSASVVLAGLVVARQLMGRARWRRFLETIPLFGPVMSWTGAAAFARMLSVLVEHEVPLPKALRLTADAVHDGNVRETCLALAEGVGEGTPLSELLDRDGRLPATLVPFVRSGERSGELSQALRSASEVFLGRVQLRASLVGVLSPPIIFVFIGLGVGFTVIALFLPLVSLIVGLS